MSFENVTLKWGDKDYVIPANRMMGAIARIEDVVTLTELRNFAARGGAPMAKLSMAYAAVLRYAGCNVSDEEVYTRIAEGKDGEASTIVAMKNIMVLMLPPNLRKQIEKSAEAAEAAEASNNKEQQSGN